MNISGVLVHAYPEQLETVQAALLSLDGIEVHGNNSDGRMVVTVEQDNAAQMSDAIVQIQNVPGVLSASMIYHRFED